MVRLFTRQNAVASGGLFLATSRASAFTCPNAASLTKPGASIHTCVPSVPVAQTVGVLHYHHHRRTRIPLFANTDGQTDPTEIQKRSNSTEAAGRGGSQKKKGKSGKKKKEKELFRADKVIASRASLSRSQAFDVLMQRRIAIKAPDSMDRLPIKGPKDKIRMDAVLYLDGKALAQLPPILIAYHKPKFMLSAMDEKHSDKKHLGMVLPDKYKKLGMHPVGRLDYDTSGLLLFSMEGELTQRLLHPKHSIEKEYVATVAGGKVDVEALKKMLEDDGVVTTEGEHFAKLLNVEELDLDKSQTIMNEHLTREASEEGEEERGDMSLPLTNVRIAVQEGKYRMVRRMLANCKHPVIELRRERHGEVELGDLQEGKFRNCEDDEIEWAEGLIRGK